MNLVVLDLVSLIESIPKIICFFCS